MGFMGACGELCGDACLVCAKAPSRTEPSRSSLLSLTILHVPAQVVRPYLLLDASCELTLFAERYGRLLMLTSFKVCS